MTDATPPPPQPRLGRHQARTRWVIAGIGVAALIGAAIMGTATARRQPARPAASPSLASPPSSLARDHRGVPPLRGVPLNTATGLRLLIANDPTPFLFDVDRGTAQPVTGLPAEGDRVVWVLPVGTDAVVVSDRSCNGCSDAGVYRVRHGTTVATRLGTASDVVAAGAGQGQLVLGSAEPRQPLSLADLRSDASYRLAWPSRLEVGIDEVRVHPNGRLVVVGFADPALPSGGQGLDEWLLDTTTRRWQQLPDMPADVTLKFTSMSWTGDGRLVFLAQTADLGDVVAVWRPGQPRIALRQVQLPGAAAATASWCGERAAQLASGSGEGPLRTRPSSASVGRGAL